MVGNVLWTGTDDIRTKGFVSGWWEGWEIGRFLLAVEILLSEKEKIGISDFPDFSKIDDISKQKLLEFGRNHGKEERETYLENDEFRNSLCSKEAREVILFGKEKSKNDLILSLHKRHCPVDRIAKFAETDEEYVSKIVHSN